MSEENVEVVRRVIEVFNRDGPEAARAFLDPELVYHDLPEQPDAGLHHGHTGFLAAVEQFTGGLEDFRIVRTLRDGLVVRMEWFGTQQEALKAVGLEQ